MKGVDEYNLIQSLYCVVHTLLDMEVIYEPNVFTCLPLCNAYHSEVYSQGFHRLWTDPGDSDFKYNGITLQ